VRLFLLGATGNSGRRILRLALDRGYQVTAFVRDQKKLAEILGRSLPQDLQVVVGDIDKSAELAEAMVGHDVVINGAGHVTEGDRFTRLVQSVIQQTSNSLGAGSRLWQFGGAAVLDVPGTDLKVSRSGRIPGELEQAYALDRQAGGQQIGKLSTPTPILSDTMKFITVNPTWNVPPSILHNEYLPALQQDPTVLDRMGIRVVRNRDGSIRMYQPPGDQNALGRLRFNFPNKFLVYQHDTPDKKLFSKTVRAYSNGCMRVQDPLKYAEVLLSIAVPKPAYTQELLRRMYGNAEQNIIFPTPIPVHLTYQTAFVDDAGKLVIRGDLYGYDERIQNVLKSSNRRVADIAVPVIHRHAADPAARLGLRRT
jgi:putative NADH-flavin reductase